MFKETGANYAIYEKRPWTWFWKQIHVHENSYDNLKMLFEGNVDWLVYSRRYGASRYGPLKIMMIKTFEDVPHKINWWEIGRYSYIMFSGQ